MLLFTKPFHAGLVDGSITLTYRAWEKPHVKVGGRYRCHPIGVLEVHAVERVRLSTVTDADAKRAGFSDLASMMESLRVRSPELTPSSEVFRVELSHGGDGDRVEIALNDQLTASDLEAIDAALAKLDAGANGAWTAKAMSLIEKQPRIAASKLAPSLGLETEPFKVLVRKLKKLGLTQAFEVGYEISPRGIAYRTARAGIRARRRG